MILVYDVELYAQLVFGQEGYCPGGATVHGAMESNALNYNADAIILARRQSYFMLLT